MTGLPPQFWLSAESQMYAAGATELHRVAPVWGSVHRTVCIRQWFGTGIQDNRHRRKS